MKISAVYNILHIDYSVTDTEFTINLGTVNQPGGTLMAMVFGTGFFVISLLLSGYDPLWPYAGLFFMITGVYFFFAETTRITRANKIDQTVTVIDTNIHTKKSKANVFKFTDIQKVDYARFSNERGINSVNQNHIIYICPQRNRPIKIARRYFTSKEALANSVEFNKVAQDFANFIGVPLDQGNRFRALDA